MTREKIYDLRVLKTKEVIYRTFMEMLCEMEFEKISVKALTERAGINRKTFYLHYRNTDELLCELEDKLTAGFVCRIKNTANLCTVGELSREFLYYLYELGDIGEKLICSSRNGYIRYRIIKAMVRTITQTGAGESEMPLLHKIITTYISQLLPAMYRDWIDGGKREPFEELAEMVQGLICGGVDSITCCKCCNAKC